MSSTTTWTGRWGQFHGTEPLTSGIWHYLPVDSIRIELNCRTPSWCPRGLLVVGKLPPLPHLVTRSVPSEVLCVIVLLKVTWVHLPHAVKPTYSHWIVVKETPMFICRAPNKGVQAASAQKTWTSWSLSGKDFWFFLKPFILCKSTLLLLSLQSCPTLCDPIDSSPPGSAVPGILQARTLEWVAISFSDAWKWKVKVKLLSHVQLLATPWTAAHQAPPSMGFSRQEYWSGVPLPSPM